VKLPGLVQYLSKHLGYDVKEIESFNKLGGAPVVSAPSFKDNVLAFSTCYGLCVQALGRAKLSTNLLPREILTQRLIRAKKPWAIAGVAAMLLACALNYAFWYNRWWEVNPKKKVNDVAWETALSDVKTTDAKSKELVAADAAKMENLAVLKKIGQEVVGAADRRVLWLEVMKALNKSLPPMSDKLDPKAPTPDVKTLPFDKRKDLKIRYVETQFFPDLAVWFNDTVKEKYLQLNPELAKAPPADGSAPVDGSSQPPPADPGMAPPMDAGVPGGAPMPGGVGGDPSMVETGPQTDLSGVAVQGPTGPGWVVELYGYHFHNDPKDRTGYGPLHVQNTLLKQLKDGEVDVPLGPGQPMGRFKMKELGIGYAILADSKRIRPVPIHNPNYAPPVGGAGTMPGTAGLGGFGVAPVAGVPPALGTDPSAPKPDPDNPEFFPAMVYEFAVQFVWEEKPLNVRLAKRLEDEQKAAEAAKAAAEAAANGAPPPTGPAVPPGAPAAPPVQPGPPQQPPQPIAPENQLTQPVAPDGQPAPPPAPTAIPQPPAAPM
jgi:type IV pilus assembly protein PilM